jgi:hypothetical protein
MRTWVRLLAGAIVLLAAWVPGIGSQTPATGDTSFARWFTGGGAANGTCDFAVARRNTGTNPDKYSAGSVWACAGDHSMHVDLNNPPNIFCTDNAIGLAHCAAQQSGDVFHAHSDATDGNTYPNTLSWQSSD